MQSPIEYLKERGFTPEDLDREGKLFAVTTAWAQDFALAHPEMKFAQTKGTIIGFCRAILRMMEQPKADIGMSKEVTEWLALESIVRIFADPALIEEWCKPTGS
jgi:hypothetical protein